MSKAKILVVDDSASMVALIKAMLINNEYEVVTAADGAEGLRVAKEINPSLIILDVMLPKMDGFTICRLLKFDEKYRGIPIVMLTAKSGDADIKIGEEIKADAYLTKPIDETALLGKIKELLAASKEVF